MWSNSNTDFHIISYAVQGICVLVLLFSQLQQVYIISLVRNPFYPSSVQREKIFRKNKNKLKYVGKIRHAIICTGTLYYNIYLRHR